MQTATFESASNWLLPLATGACANTSCGFTAGVDFGGTSTVPKIDLALDFTLSAGGTAYIQGFSGLDQRSPSQGTPECTPCRPRTEESPRPSLSWGRLSCRQNLPRR